MSGEPLSGDGYAGLYGKLPLAGDFVSRGLPDAFRARWDDWVTRHLARREGPWPQGGLRLRLTSGERTATALVLPSHDAAGRSFPLSALLVLPFAPNAAEAGAWADRALPLLDAAVAGTLDADALWEGLDALPSPEIPDSEPPGKFLLWAAGGAPLTADPDAPEAALARLLSSRGSSNP